MNRKKNSRKSDTPKNWDLKNPTHIQKFAPILAEYIKKNSLFCDIEGKKYVYCDGWKFAGTSFGFTAIPSRPINESKDKEIKFSCECDVIIIATSQKVGYGFAICSNKEERQKDFDENSVASLVQTRSISKAYRNLLGFVMDAAGFETTPADEIDPSKIKARKKYVLPDEVSEKIKSFSDYDELAFWANNQDKYIRKKVFIDEVTAKLRGLNTDGRNPIVTLAKAKIHNKKKIELA